jgi:predicted branched-subunit amino acid permease
MASSTTKSAFWLGFRDSAPFFFLASPFGFLFGVLAAEAGLNVLEAFAFSSTVFAGASQFTALQLLQEKAPLLIVMVSALAVNLRMAMYSASLTPYLGDAPMWQRALAAYFVIDQSYALSIVKFETEPRMSVPERMAYFMGTSSIVTPAWIFATVAGALAGSRIPDSWGVDFVLPLAFLAMIGPMLRTPAHVIACLVAVATALPAAILPYNLGLIVAGILGMVAGAQTEQWLERQKSKAEAAK